MLILADQPFLRPFVIDTLIEAFERDPERIVAPLIRGRRSQPTLFPKAMFSELLEVSGDMGGRTVVVSHPELFTGVELAERDDDMDVDTPEDLARAKGIIHE